MTYAIYKDIPPESFNIDDLFFHNEQPTQPTGEGDGKISLRFCCDKTVQVFEGLRLFKPSKEEFDFFVSAFDQHNTADNYCRKKDGSIDVTLDKVFRRAATLRLELKDYYLAQIRADIINRLSEKIEMKIDFQSVFDERMEAQKIDDNNSDDLAQSSPDIKMKNPKFTTAQQVLAMHYIFENFQVRGVDQSAKARFIEFLTGKSYKNIYDAVCNPMATKSKDFRKKDLQFIRPFFENLGLTEIVKMINNQLDKPDL